MWLNGISGQTLFVNLHHYCVIYRNPSIYVINDNFIALYLWCIMCARMEDTKEESGVGSPRRAVHVDTSRPRKEWGVRCVQRTWTQVGQERDGSPRRAVHVDTSRSRKE